MPRPRRFPSPVSLFRAPAAALALLVLLGAATAATAADDGWDGDWAEDDFLSDFDEGFDQEEIAEEMAEAEDAVVDSETTTTVARRAIPASRAPLATTTLDAADLARYGARGVADVLAMVPGVFVASPVTGQAEVAIRGLAQVPPGGGALALVSRRVLVLVDGRPVFADLGGGATWANLAIQREEIERIEVVRGPAAALYGPRAAAGVVQIFTTRAGDGEARGAFAGVLGDPTGHRVAVSHAGRDGRLGVRASVGVDERSRLDGGDGRLDPRDEGLAHRLIGGRLALDAARDEDGIGGGLEVGASGGEQTLVGTRPGPGGGPVRHHLERFHARATGRIGERASVDVSWSSQRQRELGLPSGAGDGDARVDEIELGARAAFALVDDVDTLMLGVHAHLLDVQEAEPWGFDDEGLVTFSAWLSNEWLAIADELTVVAAARVDAPDEPGEVGFSPMVSVLYQPVGGHVLRLTASRSVWTPHTPELFAPTPGPPGTARDARPDLGYLNVIELGTRHRVLSWVDVDLNVHYQLGEDLDGLAAGPRSGGPADGDAREPFRDFDPEGVGAEAGLRWRLGAGLSGWLSYAFENLHEGGEDLALAPEHLGGAGLTFALDGLTASASVHHASERRRGRASVDAAWLVGARVAWAHDEVELAVAGSNLGDDGYRAVPGGERLGREVWASLTVRY